MEELNQFLNSVEASARKILKQQNKKQQQLAARDRVALAKGTATSSSSSSTKSNAPTREELRASYTPGGALVVSAPNNQQSRQPATSPVRERRSEPPSDSDSSNVSSLPRLPPPRSPVASVAPGSLYASTPLPTLSQPRQKRSALKLLESPLYKSLAKARASPSGFGSSEASPGQLKRALRDVDNVGLLLRKMGLRDATGAHSPAHRADHAVEKRMCHACWAKPDKLTGCERHPRVAPSNSTGGEADALALLTSMELQGPTSWLSGDLYVKYRSEREREKLWDAFCMLKQQQQELESGSSSSDGKEHARLALVPVVTRHPVCALFATQIELENLRTQAATRKRNLAKTFIFDVDHIWLTNLDHFNVSTERVAKRQRQHSQHEQLQPQESEPRELRGRRDDAAIREGFSQIQSISSSCALQHVVAIGGASRPASSSSAHSAPQTPQTRRRPASRHTSTSTFRPLSLLVCGRWNAHEASPTALERVPGVTLVGRGSVLWWRYEPDHKPVETASGQLIPAPEFTKVVALFARSDVLSSSRAVLVSLVLALDTPVLAPRWFAWCVGSRMPPPELEAALYAEAAAESAFGRPAARAAAWPRSLLAAKLDSVLDELLPGTMALLNAVAESEDHWLELLERPNAPVGHRRGWDEFHERHSFRQWLLLARQVVLAPRYDVDARVCSVSVAHANAPGVCGRYCWHETTAVAALLCRRRVEKDLLYVLENTRSSGPNDPSYFSVAMAHEAMADVQGAKLATYLALLAAREKHAAYEKKLHEIKQKLEAGRLALEAKRQEQQRLEREQQLAAARNEARRSGSASTDAQDEALTREWLQRLASSTVLEQRALWELRELTLDDSGVVFFHSLNPELPVAHRFRWEPPEAWQAADVAEKSAEDATPPSTQRSESSSASRSSGDSNGSSMASRQRANAEAQAALAAQLLQDEHFLLQLRCKLGLSARSGSRPSSRATARPRSGASSGFLLTDDASDDEVDTWDDDVADMLENGVERSKSTLLASRMAKLQLQLPPRRVHGAHSDATRRNGRGEGWKRLKTSRLPPNFARRVYAAHTEAPRSAFINRANASQPVGMLDPTECSPHDPPEFIPELRAHFIPKANADLQERKRVWAELERNRGHETAVGSSGDAKTRRGALAGAVDNADMFERDPELENESKEQRDARALLCARNNNLEGLEAALDDGVDVNVRDNHGNTLFILVCQQGNKRLAKFLLRRRADMNLQNLNGNTALHYLYEYKHVELAEYLKAKGAVDTTQNAAGLTCYEGLSQDQVDNL